MPSDILKQQFLDSLRQIIWNAEIDRLSHMSSDNKYTHEDMEYQVNFIYAIKQSQDITELQVIIKTYVGITGIGGIIEKYVL